MSMVVVVVVVALTVINRQHLVRVVTRQTLTTLDWMNADLACCVRRVVDVPVLVSVPEVAVRSGNTVYHIVSVTV